MRGKTRQSVSDGFDEGLKGSCGGHAECCFELCESLFDWIEVGAIGWQVAKRGAGSLNRLPNASDFVTGEIVHDHDIAVAQGWDEKVLDIDQEARSIHRPIKYARRSDLIVTQGGNESCRHPMAMRQSRDEAPTTGRPSIEPHHIGLCSGFINEDKLFLVQIGLARTPLLARLGDIGTVLFGSAQ